MIVAPVEQSLVAGLIMGHFDPRLMWMVAFGIGLLSMLGYLWLHARAGAKIAARQNGKGKPEPVPVVAVE